MKNLKIQKIFKNYVFLTVCFLVMIFISACSIYLMQDEYVDSSVKNASGEEYINFSTQTISNEVDIEDVEEPSIEELMVPFDVDNAFSYCFNPIAHISDSKEEILFDFTFDNGIPESDDDLVYLYEFSTFEKENILLQEEIPDNSEQSDKKEAIAVASKNKEISFNLTYKDRYLFSRFVPAILVNGNYVALCDGKYISNPEILAGNSREYLKIDSKKGILLDSNTIDTDKLYDLNVKRAVYNIPLSLIIGESNNDVFPTIDYEYNGEIYHFNGYYCAGYDSLFNYLDSQGIHATAIILNDYNKKYPEIMHPLSRKKTAKSQYYAFNTEEEAGVRLIEATAKFLAERYSSGEHGMVYDWVIANEINQQTIWNYMATTDLNYYTESFEKSFRIFYNAIKSAYAQSNIYFSIDHDWNDNYGNNSRFFNGRDLLYKFNEYACRGGNYNWCLSLHPYPAPLSKVRFWKGEFNKTEEAGVITPMNLSALTDVLIKDEMLNTDGQVRDIAVTELGFTSRGGERLQAAAFAYCYYIIDDNKYISSFLLNRQTDDLEALKSGLALGIYNNDYSPKYIKEVFKNIDSEDNDDYLNEMLEIIGAKSLDEALLWAK